MARLTRASLAEAMRADYVRTARAKGLPARRVVGVHALRNSLIPVVTFLGIDLGSLLAGAVVTEGIFNLPGIGQAVFSAVSTQDYPVVVGVVTALVLVFIAANLSSTSSTPCSTPGSAMADPYRPSTRRGGPGRAGDAPLRTAGLWSDAWRLLRRNPLFVVPAVVVIVFVVMAIAPGLFTSADPRACDLADSLAAAPAVSTGSASTSRAATTTPGWCTAPGCPSPWVSLTVAGTVMVAVVLGSLAGYYGGLVDSVIARLTDVWFALPTVLGAIVILSVLGEKNLPQLVLVLIIFGWPTMTRLMRSAVLSVRDMEYVAAARALGAGDRPPHVPPHPAQRHRPGDRLRHHQGRASSSPPRRPCPSSAWGCSCRPSPGGS